MSKAQSAIHFETVEYKDEGTSCAGTFVHDVAAPGRLPGVLVCPTFWGSDALARRKAMQISRLGYAVLVMDPYGEGRVAQDRDEASKLMKGLLADRAVLRRRAAAALKTLRYHRRADGSHLAAIGYCFGGLVALDLARSGAELRGAASFHGSLDGGMPGEKEPIKARILAMHGAEDPLVPPAKVEAFTSEMRRRGADWQLIQYGGAVHGFTNPDAADAASGIVYNERADHRSWKLMASFLEECFADS